MTRLKDAKTVLVVDDELGPREAIRMILQDKYNVLTCENPQEVLEMVTSGKIDVVMLDIKMPKVDGLRLLKEIKALAAQVQVVLITAYPSTESAIEALRADAYDYIIKPFDKDKIKEVVHEGIIRRTQSELEKNMTSGLITEMYRRFLKNQ